MSYQDQWGRFHDKPVTVPDPIPSNNGWIYTAYAAKVGVPVDKETLQQCYNECLIYDIDGEYGNFSAHRSPGKTTPPLSRDEVLGICYLFNNFRIDLQNWNFSPFPLPRFSLLKFITQLWQLRPNIIPLSRVFDKNSSSITFVVFKHAIVLPHRNAFWQKNLNHLYRFAFSVPVQDRYFILKKWGKFRFYKPSHLFYAAVAAVDKLGPASGIRFLKYGGEKNKEAMVKEFPEDHPITFAVKNGNK